MVLWFETQFLLVHIMYDVRTLYMCVLFDVYERDRGSRYDEYDEIDLHDGCISRIIIATHTHIISSFKSCLDSLDTYLASSSQHTHTYNQLQDMSRFFARHISHHHRIIIATRNTHHLQVMCVFPMKKSKKDVGQEVSHSTHFLNTAATKSHSSSLCVLYTAIIV
jgi:hypothetical protein